MTTTTRHTFGWVFGRWLVTLQLERIERAATFTPANDADFIDWDVLAVQYGVPVNADATGLQLCAECGQSVAPGSGKFVNRIPLDDYDIRIQNGYRYPAGAFLCADCERAIETHNQQRQPEEFQTHPTRRSNR